MSFKRFSLKRINKIKSGNCTDSINSLLYLAIGHLPKECKVTENNGACRSLLVLFIDGCYLGWLIHLKISASFVGNKISIDGVNEFLQTVQYQISLASQMNRIVGIGLLRLSLQVRGIV